MAKINRRPSHLDAVDIKVQFGFLKKETVSAAYFQQLAAVGRVPRQKIDLIAKFVSQGRLAPPVVEIRSLHLSREVALAVMVGRIKLVDQCASSATVWAAHDIESVLPQGNRTLRMTATSANLVGIGRWVQCGTFPAITLL